MREGRKNEQPVAGDFETERKEKMEKYKERWKKVAKRWQEKHGERFSLMTRVGSERDRVWEELHKARMDDKLKNQPEDSAENPLVKTLRKDELENKIKQELERIFNEAELNHLMSWSGEEGKTMDIYKDGEETGEFEKILCKLEDELGIQREGEERAKKED